MAKFKKGDLVRCVDDNGVLCITRGECYKVLGEGWAVGVHIKDNSGDEGYYSNDRFERVSEMAEKEKIEAQIKQNQKEGERLQKKLADLQVTYSTGDRFKHICEKYILVRGNDCEVGLINLSNGNQWADNREVKNRHRITPAEFHSITLGEQAAFCRYWDSEKGERV